MEFFVVIDGSMSGARHVWRNPAKFDLIICLAIATAARGQRSRHPQYPVLKVPRGRVAARRRVCDAEEYDITNKLRCQQDLETFIQIV